MMKVHSAPCNLYLSILQVKMDQGLSPVESSINTIMDVFQRYSSTVTIELTQEQLKDFLEKELPNFVKVGLLPEYRGVQSATVRGKGQALSIQGQSGLSH